MDNVIFSLPGPSMVSSRVSTISAAVLGTPGIVN